MHLPFVFVILCVLYVLQEFASCEVMKIGYITGSRVDPANPLKFYQVPGQQISGAVQLAIDDINNNSFLLPNDTLVLEMRETFGNESYSIRAVHELYSEDVSVIIGPQETCMFEARLADVYDIPMISYYCNDAVVSDKSKYATFARTRPQAALIAKSLIAVLRTFEWFRVTLVYRSNEESMARTAEAFKYRAKESKVNITSIETIHDAILYDGREHSNTVFTNIVRRTYVETRIYVLITYRYEFVGFAAAMKSLGLMDDGDYFLVCADGENRDDLDRIMTGFLMSKPSDDVIAAFRSVLAVVPSPPKYPDFERFSILVNQYLEKPPFNFTTKLSELGILKDILPEAAYLYDAVVLFARAAEKAIKEGKDFSSGRVIMNYLRNLDYVSATGLGNRLDARGDAEGNYTVLYRHKYEATWAMKPIGTFHKTSNGSLKISFYPNEGIDWITGSPPLYAPECGYYGEKCRSDTWKYAAGVMGAVLLISGVIFYVVYRRRKYEQDLAKMLWRVDWKDVQTKSSGHNFAHNMAETQGLLSAAIRASQTSIESAWGDVEYRHVYTSVGLYKGTLVAIKPINKKAVDITRTVQKDMKLLKDIRHVNLTQFYGACIDSPNIAVLTEYCPKGSLQDVLGNTEIKMDTYITTSIVNDMMKGLAFIHASDLHYHGRMKSSNCLIDSRWMLKLTEYGLANFRHGEEQQNGEHAFYQGLFWTAPEHLQPPYCTGSAKGDIYSLAIVLYEIYARAGPYEDEGEPRDIIARIQKIPEGEHPSRPRLATMDSVPKFVTDCISECWSEDPHCRPDIHGVRARLKPIQKGLKSNMMDNMIAIMERYATNLEEIVQERTEQLVEEKKKTEELLLQMLPKSVAEQLKLGKQVEAEAFESVSLYFSDICGFTALSSASSPMQIVDLLNDLYTCFDIIISEYDCYKIETIGDAYFCVSGLPNRNGIRHAGEIAKMSLHLLRAIKKFTIRHRPDETLKLRIGIHSGACVAGVVGRKMPRYCLFGDAVNTCSRMESTGEPLKIHCSNRIIELLQKLGGYDIEKRGLVPMKGKGEQMTYWLNGHADTPTLVNDVTDGPNVQRDRSMSDVNNGSRTSLKDSGDKNHNHDKITQKLHSATSPIRKFFGRRSSTSKMPTTTIPMVIEENFGDHKVDVLPEESPLLSANSLPNIQNTCI